MASCRYCGKPLPLLERISGPGTFCSREHKEKYQEEYSRLALRRLLGESDDEQETPAQVAQTAESKTAETIATASRVAAVSAAVARPESDGRAAAPPGKTPIPRIAPAIQATPDFVPLRRGARPRLPVPGWTWRVDWESELLAEGRLDERPAPPEPKPRAVSPSPVHAAPLPVEPPQQPAVIPLAAAAPSMAAAVEAARPDQGAELEQPVIPAFKRVRVEPPKALTPPAPVATPAAHTIVAGPPVAAAPIKPPEAPPPPAVEAPQPEPKRDAAPVEAAPETEPAEFALPGFQIAEKQSFLSRVPLVLRVALVLVAVVLIGFGIHRFTSRTGSAKPAAVKAETARAIAMGPGGWFTNDMPDRTKERTRAGAFSIYRPSLELSDYRIEFTGRIESMSLGWVVRWKDPENYQAVKLARQAGRYRLTRHVMMGGEVSARHETPLTGVTSGVKGYNIRMDVRGPRFTVFLQGQQIDSWTEHRLARGGFGFLNEGEERGRIDSIQVFVLNR